MSINYLEFNASVSYLIEGLAGAERDLGTQKPGARLADLKKAAESSLYARSLREIDQLIQNCLRAHDSNGTELAKFQIFAFLMVKHFGFETCLQAPSLSLDLILNLAVGNGFTELFTIADSLLDEPKKSEFDRFFSSFVEDLFAKSESNDLNRQRIIAAFMFGSFKNFLRDQMDQNDVFKQVYRFVSTNRTQLDSDRVNHLFNEFLIICYDSLNLHKPLNLTKDAWKCVDESKVLSLFREDRVFSRIKAALVALKSLTLGFTVPLSGWRAVCLSNCLYFISLLKVDSSLSEEVQTVIRQFSTYLIKQIEASHQIKFDDYFVMRHRMFGFEKLFQEQVINAKRTSFSLRDVQVIKCLSDRLTSASSLYALLRSLDLTVEKKDAPSFIKLKTFLWQIFEELAFNEKTKLIGLIYDQNELKLIPNKSGVYECLYDKCFLNESTLVINQLSAENCEDSKMLNKIARLMCMSLPMFTEKLVLYGLGNKNQLPTFLKIFHKFSSNLSSKIALGSNQNALIGSLGKSLKSTLHAKSEKSLQNLLNFVKLLIKPNKSASDDLPALINADEFFDQVLKEHFRLDPASIDSLVFVFELYEILLKQLSVDVTHLAFLIETANVINYREMRKSNQSQLLALKDKSLALARQLVKKLGFSDPVKSSAKSYEWLHKCSLHMDWPYSSLLVRLTKRLILPPCLENLKELSLVNDESIVVVCNQVETDPLTALLELAALNRDFKSKISRIQSLSLDPSTLVNRILEVLHDNRSIGEYGNLFEFVLFLIGENDVEIAAESDIESVLNQAFQEGTRQRAKILAYLRFLSLMTSLIESICADFDIDVILTSFRFFVKEAVQSFEDERSQLYALLFSIYYSEKLVVLMEIDAHAQEQMHFTIELSNMAVKVAEKSTVPRANESVHVNTLLELCSKYFDNIEEKNKNYKYLLDQNFIGLIDTFKQI